MRTVAVIGLGRFGERLARRLAKLGMEVMAVDLDRDAVERLRDVATIAVALDATDENAVRSKGVHKVEAAVIGIGEDFEATVLATVMLKQLGVPRVIARARSRTSAMVLERVGADQVVMPEDEAADRWAARIVGPAVLNQIEFHEGYSIVELKCPDDWTEKSLVELGVRANYGLHVVAVKRTPTAAEAAADGAGEGVRIVIPGPNEPLRESDVLVLMGKDEDLARRPGG